jgi:hypothetical protein
MILTGRSEDGSDVYPAMGVFTSPDGEEWSNKPYTKEDKMWEKVYNHLSKNLRTLRDEYKMIMDKKSTLPRVLRDYIVWIMNKDEII